MLKVSTVEIEQDDLRRFIANARRLTHFRPKKDSANYLTFIQDKLIPLDNYEIKEVPMLPGISIQHKGKIPLNDFLNISNAVEKITVTSVISLDIAESSKDYDVSEDRDIQISFGRNFLAPMFKVSVGSVSRGTFDLSCRKNIFNGFLRVFGLEMDIQAVFVEGELDIEIHTDTFKLLKSVPRNQLSEAYVNGTRFIDKGATNLKARNFSDLTLYCFTLDELIQKVPAVIELYGGKKKIVHSEFSVACKKENYLQVRSVLNQSPFSPWKISFTAISKYTLDNIDKAINETNTFLFRAFTLKPPRVGEVDVDVYYEKGSFFLQFTCEYKSNEQEQVLEELIIDLADGKDIIDRTPL
jgi:hypothetical protein